MKLIESHLDYSKQWKLPDVYLFTGNNAIIRAGGNPSLLQAFQKPQAP